MEVHRTLLLGDYNVHSQAYANIREQLKMGTACALMHEMHLLETQEYAFVGVFS